MIERIRTNPAARPTHRGGNPNLARPAETAPAPAPAYRSRGGNPNLERAPVTEDAVSPPAVVADAVSSPAAPVVATEPAAPVLDPVTPESAPVLTVTKIGRKYFVTDTNGNKATDARFDPAGYSNDADAWAAVVSPAVVAN